MYIELNQPNVSFLQICETLVYVEISLSPIFLFNILNPTKDTRVIEKSKLPSLAVCLAKFKLSSIEKEEEICVKMIVFLLALLFYALGNVYFKV